MPFTFTMPKLSPTMEEGTIAKWHKKEGDFVRAGDLVLEVATDKATVEHNALDEGFLRKILVKEGLGAVVNQPIAIFTEKKEESIEGYQPEGEVGKTAPLEAIPCLKAAEVAIAPEEHIETTGRLFASPLARRLARERGLELSKIKGSGPHGRILSRDLEKLKVEALVQPVEIPPVVEAPVVEAPVVEAPVVEAPVVETLFVEPTPVVEAPPTPVIRETPAVSEADFEEIPLTPMRKVIAQRLQESKSTIPHFYETQEVIVDRLVAVRNELADNGIKLTYNDFVLRAVALSLKEHPAVNSGFNAKTQAIIRFKTIDISVAVSLESGLITPIIRNADTKKISELSSEMKDLGKRAKEGKLSLAEFVGGSFTISNIGMFGITEFKAIINPPQAAILAVGGIIDQPIVKEGQVVPGKVMRLTISADHRVLDGTDVAKFLKTLQKHLENPSLLLICVKALGVPL